LTVGLSALVLAAVLGVPIGLASGYYRGRFDKIVMRFADIQLAFPAILLALAILAAAGPSNLNLIAVLALSLWVIFARVVRGEVLSLRQREFIGAAVAMGAGDLRIFRRHVLPNLAGTLLVLASVSLTRVILAEAALSFLGMGIQPPTPTWGGMISDGRAYLAVAWWVATMPGLALTLAVIGFNLLGDYLRDRIDPRLRS
jgi:peptide/nickel transport system permease protein